MLGSERSNWFGLALVVLVFATCTVLSLSVWLSVFFGLLAVLHVVGMVGETTTAWPT